MSCCGDRQRRRFAPWRLCLLICTIISTTGTSGSAPDNFGTDTLSSSSSARKTLNQEIGSPSELAWQAWLLVENKGGGQSALDSSNILRRITPKSIFIAPELVACPSGYTSDGKGVCKPDPIKLDEDAQRQFFLKRLNALYGKFGNNRKKPSDTTGPLQINIPLSLPSKANPPDVQPIQPQRQSEPTTHKPEQSLIMEDRVAIPVVISQQPLDPNSNKSQEAVAVVIYKVENDTKKDEKESTEGEKTSFFLGTSNSSLSNKNNAQISRVVPVAEIIDNANHTFAGIVDYKIPLSLKTLNKSSITGQEKTDDVRHQSEKKEITERPDLTDDLSPTVVLLLSPTKLPYQLSNEKETISSNTDSDQTVTDLGSDSSIESTTIQRREDDVKFESDFTIQTVAPLETQTVDDLVNSTPKNTERTYTEDRPEDETVYSDEETQTEQESEEYDDTTDGIDDFSESEDELLKPGEAGMMISSKNQDFIRSQNQSTQSTTMNLDNLTSTTPMETTTIPTYPTVDTQDSLDTSESTVRTDATDYTRDYMTTQTTELPSTIITTETPLIETTTYKPRISKLKIRATTPLSIILTTDSAEEIDSFETERDLVTEPEVILSTQNSHSITTAYGQKRPTHPAKIEISHTYGNFEDVISKTEQPLLTDFHRRNPLNHRQQKPTIIVQNDRPILFKNEDDIPSEFRDQIVQSSKLSSTDFKEVSSLNDNPPTSFVKFPEQTAESRLEQQTYVRFPSDEVNSIHNQDNYKDHLSAYLSRDEYNNNAPSSTKSSVPVRPKSPSSHWRLPISSLRMDRQQSQLQIQTNSNTNNQRQQKQKPTLLGFWARMPLIRDLSFYPTTSHGSHNEPIGGQEETHRLSRLLPATPTATRRMNYYNEMTSHDVNRLLAQQLGRPAIGG